MIDWSSYYLKDEPFVESAHIDPTSSDPRINGTIFSRKGVEEPYDSLLAMIQRHKPISYVLSESKVLGTGKSALLAGIYWKIKTDKTYEEEFLPAWVSVGDFRNITQLTGKILDTFVFLGFSEQIKDAVQDLTPSSIDKFLSSEKLQRSPSVVWALSKIFSMQKEEVPWKYVNIRRSISTVSTYEIFEYIMTLFKKTTKRRVLVFIDQFEDYIEHQRSSAQLTQLGEDLNHIHRAIAECGNLSLITTLHPVAKEVFEASAGALIGTFGGITENSVMVKPFRPDDLLEMCKLYIKHYRIENHTKKVTPLFPFDENVVTYIAEKAGGNPRIFIRLVHNVLLEAAIRKQPSVSKSFIDQPAVQKMTGFK
jgi:hypothetical protein